MFQEAFISLRVEETVDDKHMQGRSCPLHLGQGPKSLKGDYIAEYIGDDHN